MSVELLRKQFTVQDYRKMSESGILKKNDRVELIRGEIVDRVTHWYATCCFRATLEYFIFGKAARTGDR